MNERDIFMLVGGFGAGVAATGIAGYIWFRNKYGSVKDLEKEVNDLNERKHELCLQIDYIQKSFEDLKKSHEEKVEKYEEEITMYEDTLRDVKKEAEDIPQPTDPYDIQDDRLEEVGDTEPQEDSVTNYWTSDGHFVICDSGPRMNGELTDDEQREFDEADGDTDIEHTILTGIRRKRYHDSIDDDNAVYQISKSDHEKMPEFFDEESLDYYEADDILANGMTVVDNLPMIIDPVVLNKFGRDSMSDDPDEVYCRNDYLDIDYVIRRHKGSYQHEVLGIPDEKAYQPRKFNKELADEMEESRGKGKKTRR